MMIDKSRFYFQTSNVFNKKNNILINKIISNENSSFLEWELRFPLNSNLELTNCVRNGVDEVLRQLKVQSLRTYQESEFYSNEH